MRKGVLLQEGWGAVDLSCAVLSSDAARTQSWEQEECFGFPSSTGQIMGRRRKTIFTFLPGLLLYASQLLGNKKRYPARKDLGLSKPFAIKEQLRDRREGVILLLVLSQPTIRRTHCHLELVTRPGHLGTRGSLNAVGFFPQIWIH